MRKNDSRRRKGPTLTVVFYLGLLLTTVGLSGCSSLRGITVPSVEAETHRQAASAWDEAAWQHEVHYDQGRPSLYPGDRFPSLGLFDRVE